MIEIDHSVTTPSERFLNVSCLYQDGMKVQGDSVNGSYTGIQATGLAQCKDTKLISSLFHGFKSRSFWVDQGDTLALWFLEVSFAQIVLYKILITIITLGAPIGAPRKFVCE